MQRVSALVRAPRVGAEDLGFLAAPTGEAAALDWPDEDLPAAVARLEEFLIRRALRRSNGNRAEAARALNIRRQFLYAKLERYGLATSAERTGAVPDDDTAP